MNVSFGTRNRAESRRNNAFYVLVLVAVAVITLSAFLPITLAGALGLSPQYVGAPTLVIGQSYSANMPDPDVVYDASTSTYWAYSTSTGGPYLPVFSSSDLRTWVVRSEGGRDALPLRPGWALGSADGQWAPGVIKLGSRWLLFSSWPRSTDQRCIAVASSSSPAGPFIDLSSSDFTRGPVVCDSTPGGSIDPEPFLAPDGSLYLTWKSEAGIGRPTQIWSQRMSSDGLSIAPGSTPALLLQPALAWERGVVENPSLAVIDGTYWLLYSAAAWDSANYRMGAARCSGPLGPCNRVGTDPLFGNTSSELGPGGGSFFTDVAGRTRIAHHVWNSPHTSYPSDPNCDRAGLCASQGQRYLRIDGVLSSSGTLTSNAIGSLDTVVSAGGQI